MNVGRGYSPRIALVGDHDSAVTAHRAIPLALDQAAERLGVEVSARWIGTDRLFPNAATALAGFHGIWCVPATPYASTEGALLAVRFARERGTPFLGTCGGFQHALLEYARDVLGLEDATHAEIDSEASDPLIAPLSCSLIERSGRVRFAPGTRVHAAYGSESAEEEYHCRYGLNPSYEKRFDGGPLRVAARDEAGEVRAVELVGHPFFVATLFQPERAALAGRSHPLIEAFVGATRCS